jgi:WD40 repeat protein
VGGVFVGHVGRDAAFAEALEARLGTLGRPPAEDLGAADAAIFVVTPAAVASPAWLAELEQARRLGTLVVPVARIAVPDGALPESVGTPIAFEAGSDPEVGLAAVLAALGWAPAAEPEPEPEPPPAPTTPAPEPVAPPRSHRRAVVMGIVGVAVVAVLAGAAVASRSGSGAARSRALAAQSAGEVVTDPARAIVLAASAVRHSPTPEAMFALRRALDASPLVGRIPAVGSLPTGAGPGISWSPNGAELAIGSEDGRVRLCRTGPAGRCRVFDVGAPAPVVAFSPDGSRLAAGGVGDIRILDPGSGGVTAFAEDTPGSTREFAWAPDSSSVWFTGGDGVGRVSARGRLTSTFPLPTPDGSGIATIAIRPDGRQLVVAGRDRLLLLDARTGRVLRQSISQGTVVWLAYAPDGRSILSAEAPVRPENYRRGGIFLYDAGLLGEPRAVGGGSAFALSSDGRLLAFGTADGDGGVTDLATGRRLVSFPRQSSPIVRIAFSPDGRYVATVAASGQVLEWRANAGEQVTVHTGGDEPAGLSFAANVAVALDHAGRAVVETFSAEGDRAQTTLDVGPAEGTAMRLAGDAVVAGAPILGTPAIPTLTAWAVRYHRVTGRFAIPEGGEAPAVSNDGSLVAYRDGRSGAAVVQDARGGTMVMQPLRRCSGAVRFDFAPDASAVTGIDKCGELALWDARTGALVHPLLHGVLEAWFSPGGGVLGLVRTGGTIDVVDVRTWRTLQTMRNPGRDVRDLAISTDDSTLATAGGDGTVRLWDVRTGEPLRLLQLPGPVGFVAFDPVGRELATVDADGGTLRIWDACPGCDDPATLLALARAEE